MPGDAEVSVRARNFRGVNVAVDAALLDNRDLQTSENWVPQDFTGLLAKRKGLSLVFVGSNTLTRIDALLRAYDLLGNRYLYMIQEVTGTGDALLYLIGDDTTPQIVTGGTFVAKGGRYGMAVIGNTLYVSNGDAAHDPYLLTVNLATPGTAVQLSAIGALSDTGQSAVLSTATAAPLPPGLYSYQWAVLYAVGGAGIYLSLGPVETIQIGANQFVTFTAPSGALSANQTYVLFVTEANLPAELATNQTPMGLNPSPGAGSTYIANAISTTGPLVPTRSGVARVGRFLVPHRGTLFVAGDLANPSALYQSTVIVPGLEQAIYNLGNFFPALAQVLVNPNDGDTITGIGVASITSTDIAPDAPLAIFKSESSWLLFGDINDPNNPGELIQLSRRIGCIAHGTVVNTPAGLIFCGRESVYLLPPALQEPVDIGWPISPIIKAIPNTLASQCFAVYHNGFYKLFLVSQGGSAVTESWWLDLHRQRVDDPPSWWGPQRFTIDPGLVVRQQLQAQAATTGAQEPSETSRGWLAGLLATLSTGTGAGVTLLDQAIYNDQTNKAIVSRLRTKAFGGEAGFDRKVFTRARAIALAGSQTHMDAQLTYDGGMVSQAPGSLSFAPSAGSVWSGPWNGSWGFAVFTEGDVRFTSVTDRAPHLYADLTLVHSDPTAVSLRDIELTYLPVPRPTA